MLYAEMVDDITHKQITDQDTWGEFTYTSISRKALIDWKNRNIQTPDGTIVVSTAIVRMRPLTIVTTVSGRATATIHSDDRITIDGVEHRILKIAKVKSLTKTFILEVWVA